MPSAQRTKTRDPYLAKVSLAAQVRQQGMEHTQETRTTHPTQRTRTETHPPRQDAPGRKMLKTQRTTQGPQDHDAGSISNPNPAGAHTPDPTSSPDQVRQQGKKPIPETGKTHPTKRMKTWTPPRAKTPDPLLIPTPLEPTPGRPNLPQPKRTSREEGRPSEKILETPDV